METTPRRAVLRSSLRRLVPDALRLRISNRLIRAATKARDRGLDVTVDANDTMALDGSLKIYFRVGADALRCIEDGIARARPAADPDAPMRIIDLPSGHGRVLRYLRRRWPDAAITAMDLMPDAVEFCADRFGATPVVSEEAFWAVEDAGTGFDMLWSGSLLTHLPDHVWLPALTYFRDRLRTGGLMIFTTHGDRSIRFLERQPDDVSTILAATAGAWDGDYGLGEEAPSVLDEVERSGFSYRPYDWYPGGGYGLSFSTPGWVRWVAGQVDGIDLVHHEPHGWFEHQDVWTYVRTR